MKRKRQSAKINDKFQVEEIETLLRMGKKEREIADIYRCKIGEIYKIKQKVDYEDAMNIKKMEDANKAKDMSFNSNNSNEDNIINIDDIIPVPIKTTNDDEPKTTRKRRISKEEKDRIILDIRKGISVQEVAKKHSVSQSTVSRFKAEYKAMQVQLVKEDTKATFDSTKLITVQDNAYVKLGLVADRHNINPVDSYIFETFDSDIMFDYTKQIDHAREFLLNKIPFSYNKPAKGLMLYATGLQAALVSVIKVCEEYDIPLVVMHYNAEDKTYYPQNYNVKNEEVFAKVPAELDTIVKRVRLVQLYNCIPEDLKSAKNIYEVRSCWYDMPNGSIARQVIATDIVIFVNKNAAWDYFRIKAEEATPKLSVFINNACIDSKGKYTAGNSIARVTN